MKLRITNSPIPMIVVAAALLVALNAPAFAASGGCFLEVDFWTTLMCAIKCRTRFAVTQAEAALAIATSLHR